MYYLLPIKITCYQIGLDEAYKIKVNSLMDPNSSVLWLDKEIVQLDSISLGDKIKNLKMR